MEHSIALVTGATSGLGYAAARTLAGEGWREIIVTGRSLARAQEAAAQLAAETKRQVFTPLELSGRFLGPTQAAASDDDLAPALSGKSAGCRITEPGGGAGDERDRMFHGRLRGKG